ncbi:MAG TPA: type II toxin-antitoxin system RelE/ParE family toxin [Tepidisphaeraceae bacterium]|nr:type II toxin-antitoxin system RelE/ParE family toxin [Tepidisphaeraceae bacterium]
MWRIEYTRSALKALRRMPRNVATTIQKKIAALAVDPYGPNNNATRLQGREGYRLRVGDWRVLYELEAGRLLVLDIKPRGGAYE